MHLPLPPPGPPRFNPPPLTGSRTAAILLVTLVIMAGLASAWEFFLEQPVTSALGLPYSGTFDLEERLDFIITSVAFAGLALVGPGLLLAWLVRRLEQMRRSLEQARQEANALARHDALTGLPNRRLFKEELQRTIAAAAAAATVTTVTAAEPAAIALMLVDLDRFKTVNDAHGHQAGDEALLAVADLLRDAAPEHAVVSRLGGDEFGILSHEADPHALCRLAQRVAGGIAGLRLAGGRGIGIGATIGIARFPDDGADGPALLHAADAALSRAKEMRGSCQFFEPGLGEELRRAAALREDLRAALSHGEIIAHYQPIIDLRTGAVSAFEALARWHHPVRGNIPPAVFIPLAEEAGLIDELTRAILRQACRAALDWPEPMIVAVNLSPLQLVGGAAQVDVLAILAASGLPARRLEIEITENALVRDMARAKAALAALCGAGIRIALDDFGTGYSSLYHLRELPITMLKIDRSFLNAIHEDDSKRRLMDGIIGLARSLGIETTAEGIEQTADASWLGRHRCDFGQGFLYAKAMPAAAIPGYLATHATGALVSAESL